LTVDTEVDPTGEVVAELVTEAEGAGADTDTGALLEMYVPISNTGSCILLEVVATANFYNVA